MTTPSDREPNLIRAIPLLKGIMDLGLLFINESIVGYFILSVLPKICPSLPLPSKLKSLFETVSWNPFIILDVSMREQTPIPSPPIARRLT